MKKTSKILALLLTVTMSLILLAGCSDKSSSSAEASKSESGSAESSSGEISGSQEGTDAKVPEETVKIAVMTYSTTDGEVLAFKDYYVNYIAPGLMLNSFTQRI